MKKIFKHNLVNTYRKEAKEFLAGTTALECNINFSTDLNRTEKVNIYCERIVKEIPELLKD